MAKMTRGEFLGFGAALLGGLGFPRSGPPTFASARGQVSSPSTSGHAADLVVHNARVYTSDPDQPRAEAFAVQNGRFAAVGRWSDIRNLSSPRTRVLDAGGVTVTPGFIDCHCHPSGVNERGGYSLAVPTSGSPSLITQHVRLQT